MCDVSLGVRSTEKELVRAQAHSIVDRTLMRHAADPGSIPGDGMKMDKDEK